MKIVFVTQPLSTGGAERVVASLSNRFFELGHEVKIIIVDNGDKNVYYTYPDIELVYVKKPKNAIIDLLYRAKKIREFLNFYQPDVVLPFTTQKNVSVLLATLFTKNKVIISERNNPYKDPKSKALRILRKILYWTAAGYVFQTEDAKKYFSEKIQNRACIIYNPINDKIPPAWNGAKEHRIVMVNRLDEQKNIKMAIDAFTIISKQFNDYVLEIYGKGPLEEEISLYIKENKMDQKIILKGFCADVLEQIKKAEIYLMTSNYEGMSNSLMEALALGLVCISTDHPTGGARALIKSGENGMLFPVKDIDACVKILKMVLESNDLKEKLSKNATSIREKLSIESVADEWINYLNKKI